MVTRSPRVMWRKKQRRAERTTKQSVEIDFKRAGAGFCTVTLRTLGGVRRLEFDSRPHAQVSGKW